MCHLRHRSRGERRLPADDRFGGGACSFCGVTPERFGARLCRACAAAYARGHRTPHRDLPDDKKRRAICRAYTNVLVRRGHLTRGKCAICGENEVQAHHPDHDNPRCVVWLCRTCHRQHHVQETVS